MEATALFDLEDGYRSHRDSLIMRKPVGSSAQTQTYSQISQVSSEQRTPIQMSAWQPKFGRIAPLLGLSAIGLTILSIPAAFIVLRISDGQPVSSWTYSPSVYLAIMTAFTSKAMSLAALQGAVVAWWLRALSGSTFEQLHRDWQMGQNVWDALIAGRHTNMIAIACIAATIAAIDAPLLQRASSVVSRAPNSPVQLDVNLVPELPAYYSGQVAYTDYTTYIGVTTDPNPDFYPVMVDWLNEKPIGGLVKGCPGSCSTKIRAPMIEVWNCTESSRYVNYTQTLAGNLTWEEQQTSPELENRTAFYATTSMGASYDAAFMWGEREFMIIVVGLSDANATATCGGNYNEKICLLSSAVGEYDLITRDNETTFQGGSAKPTFIRWANNTAMTDKTNAEFHLSYLSNVTYNDNYNSTFAGITFASWMKWDAKVQFIPIDWPYHPNINGINAFVQQYIKDYVDFNRGDACIPEWIDPFNDMLSSLNELAFRIAVHASRPDFRDNLTSHQYLSLDPDLEIEYIADGLYISQINVFVTDYPFFVGAALIQLVCAVVIMNTFYGWWRLGRPVSFSPLELAKAFQAPLLYDVNSNAGADSMAEQLGSKSLRYGVVGGHAPGLDDLKGRMLAFGNPNTVSRPIRHTLLGR